MTSKTIAELEAELAKAKAQVNIERFNSLESIKETILSEIKKNPDYEGKPATVLDSDDDIRKESYSVSLEFVAELVNSIIKGSEYKAVKPASTSRRVNLVKVN